MSDYVAEAGERILKGCMPVPESGCWEWIESTKNGYGQLSWKGRNTYAHRLSFEAENGPLTKGVIICHKCNNRNCVNPEHLYAGTKRSNIMDCIKTGVHSNQHGPITLENCNV